jgi:hypothetical protein
MSDELCDRNRFVEEVYVTVAAVANPSRVVRVLAVRIGSPILPTAGAIALSMEVRFSNRGRSGLRCR